MKVDFIAELTYKTSEEGGRRTPVHSMYYPNMRFEIEKKYLTASQHVFLERELVEPGEKIEAKVLFLSTDYFSGRLFEGLKLEFCEGQRVVGTEIIQNIINQDLRKF